MSRPLLLICRGFLVNKCLEGGVLGEGVRFQGEPAIRGNTHTHAHGHQKDHRASGLSSPEGVLSRRSLLCFM